MASATANDVHDFGAVLRRARKEKGLTQGSLARAVRVNPSTINRLEAGTRAPSFELAERIEIELDASIFTVKLCACGCGGSTLTTHLPGHRPGSPKGYPPGRPWVWRNRRPASGTGDRLREARIAHGWTQAELGRRVHASTGTIHSIEHGADDPSERLAISLQDAVGVPGLFDLRLCPCLRCSDPERSPRLTVGGKLAPGHREIGPEERKKRAESLARSGREARPMFGEWLERRHEDIKLLVDEHQRTAGRLVGREGVRAILGASNLNKADRWLRRHGIRPVRYVEGIGRPRPLYRAHDVRKELERTRHSLVARFGGDEEKAASWYFRTTGTKSMYGWVYGRRRSSTAKSRASTGIPGSSAGRRRKATPDETREVWHLYDEGLSYREIAAKVFGRAALKNRVSLIVRGPRPVRLPQQ